MPEQKRQFTIRQWVLWTATAGMLVATFVAPSHKFIYPFVYFIILLMYVVLMLARGLKDRARKLTIHEEWQIDEIRKKNTKFRE